MVAVLLLGDIRHRRRISLPIRMAQTESYATIAKLPEQQQSAMYRRVMNQVYAPIAEAGGWTGWGVLEVPHVRGMKSIDNHYLLVYLPGACLVISSLC